MNDARQSAEKTLALVRELSGNWAEGLLSTRTAMDAVYAAVARNRDNVMNDAHDNAATDREMLNSYTRLESHAFVPGIDRAGPHGTALLCDVCSGTRVGAQHSHSRDEQTDEKRDAAAEARYEQQYQPGVGDCGGLPEDYFPVPEGCSVEVPHCCIHLMFWSDCPACVEQRSHL